MKLRLLVLTSCLLGWNWGHAQSLLQFQTAPHQHSTKPTPISAPKSIVWSEDFDIGTTAPTSTQGPTFNTANGTWTTGGTDGIVWKHSFFGTSGEWSAGTPPFTSTTNANGFMLFDADSVNLPYSPNYIFLQGELISPPIDLTNETSAVLSWEQNARYCCVPPLGISVAVSSDGGSTWGPQHDVSNGIGPSDDFYASNGDSYLTSLNLTTEAAGNTVLLKFTWNGGTGNSHYFWTLDDMVIRTLPDDDVRILSSWFQGENHGGQQYGIHDPTNPDVNYIAGAEIYNAGTMPQTNFALDIDFGFYTESITIPLLEPDSTIRVQGTQAIGLPSTGFYAGTFSVIAGTDTLGGVYGNDNTALQEFHVSFWQWTEYAVDGIGVYSSPLMNAIGTNSFIGGEDGLVMVSKYHFTDLNPYVYGMKVMLDATTVPGGELFGSIKDSATFWSNDMTSVCSMNSVAISPSDVALGYVWLFASGCALTSKAYYAAVELYSNGGTAHIVIQDDLTVEQPVDASGIFIPGDQSYTNGNALGIRLILNPESLPEHQLDGIFVYPNPNNGIFTIANETNMDVVLTVSDLEGRFILMKKTGVQETIDLSMEPAGVYLLTIQGTDGTMTERIVIN